MLPLRVVLISLTSKLTHVKSNNKISTISEICHTAAAAAKLLQSCPTLCNPIDSSPPDSAIPGILQARTLEWVAIFFSNAWKWKVKSESEVAQSCPTLLDPMDCGPPGSSVHGIFQARVLEWGAIAFSVRRMTVSYWTLLLCSCASQFIIAAIVSSPSIHSILGNRNLNSFRDEFIYMQY